MAMFVLGVVVVAALWPRVIAWPLAFFCGWVAISWLLKSLSLWRSAQRQHAVDVTPQPASRERVDGTGGEGRPDIIQR